jgi:ABC-type lipoprotein export system ATPase subunit
VIHRPALLIADEPTGNLDTDNGRRVLDILRTLNEDTGVAVLLATHDQAVAARADRILRMRDGLVVVPADATRAALPHA